MSERDQDWSVASDLLDDFNLTITSAKFAYSGDDAETVSLILEGTTDSDEQPVLNEEGENSLRVKVGKKWVIENDGATIQHESGKKKPLNPNSHYGMWVAGCIEELGIGNVLKSRGTMRDAAVWVGLTLHIDRKEFTGEIEGEKRKWSKALPSKFVGEGASGSVAKAVTSTTTTTAAAAADVVSAVGSMPEMAPKVKAKLMAAAKGAADYAAFVDAAFDVDGVSDDTNLQAFLMSEDSYTTLRG